DVDNRVRVVGRMVQRVDQMFLIGPDELGGGRRHHVLHDHQRPPKAMSLVSMYSSRPSAPASRPSPLSFQPTNGASTACGVHSLTPIIPNCSCSAARVSVRRSFVHT